MVCIVDYKQPADLISKGNFRKVNARYGVEVIVVEPSEENYNF